MKGIVIKMGKVVVSACLLGRNCKYSGGNNYSEKLHKWLEGKEVIEVCPEVAGGLPTPRTPVELVNGVATDRDGISRDTEFHRGSSLILKELAGEEIECVILQSRSPSCGVKQIYDGTFSGQLIPGQGIFARDLIEQGYKAVDVEDIL